MNMVITSTGALRCGQGPAEPCGQALSERYPGADAQRLSGHLEPDAGPNDDT